MAKVTIEIDMDELYQWKFKYESLLEKLATDKTISAEDKKNHLMELAEIFPIHELANKCIVYENDGKLVYDTIHELFLKFSTYHYKMQKFHSDAPETRCEYCERKNPFLNHLHKYESHYSCR